MSRRRRQKTAHRVFASPPVRDTFAISTPRRAAVKIKPLSRYVPRLQSLNKRFPYLSLVEDNRSWNPTWNVSNHGRRRTGKLLLSVSGLPARINTSGSLWTLKDITTGSVPSQLAFRAPRKVVMCIRRGVRRQVLFARGVSGSGRTTKHPRFTIDSQISCRR